MPDDHITDEQIHSAAGGKFRAPTGAPKATCLNCGEEHTCFYASQAHDCRIDLGERRPYADWLLRFQRYGLGVLRVESDAKFPFAKIISGRKALTFHLQSDLEVGPGYELVNWYDGEKFRTFPPDADDLLKRPSEAMLPRQHSPEFEKQPTPGLDRHREGNNG